MRSTDIAAGNSFPMEASGSADKRVNVTSRLALRAQLAPGALAVAAAQRTWTSSSPRYRTITFAELESTVDQIARSLAAWGVVRGSRLVLLVPPGIEFVALVLGMLRAGVVVVLVDAGLGRSSLIRCLEAINPDGFVAVPIVHLARRLFRHRFPHARFNVNVGRGAFGDTVNLEALLRRGGRAAGPCATLAEDPAAVLFTSGSTGPPKGVLYTHGMFDAQVELIQARFGIRAGEVDLAGFPLFGLFDAAMGVSTIFPPMDYRRPAYVDPRQIVRAVEHWGVTQAFGSPAMWRPIGQHCAARGIRLQTLQRVLSAGASVPVDVVRAMTACLEEGALLYTPYGATEALPLASIDSQEILAGTATATADGKGVCVGSRFPEIEWKVIHATDEPIASIEHVRELPRGQIGELIVRGPVVSSRYVTHKGANLLAKIHDGMSLWHRMGDVGYLDDRDRFWYCGRKSHRVATPRGILYTECCEAIMNRHPRLARCALVGVGPWGNQTAVIVAEPSAGSWPVFRAGKAKLTNEIVEMAASHPLTAGIGLALVRRRLPVDIRHNAKIGREELAAWAKDRLGSGR